MWKTARKFDMYGLYGSLQVMGLADRPYRAYKVKCTVCGHEFVYQAKEIMDRGEKGCAYCTAISKDEERLKKAREYIGHTFGSLEVKDVLGFRPYCGRKEIFVLCECKQCGSLTEIWLSRLKQGGASVCSQCCQKNLKTGHEITKMSAKDGTSVIALKRANLNKNNTSGFRGVSYIKKLDKYRAYINFKRKQYNLGLYSDIKDAVKARKAAEEHIYGDFLKYYAEVYPENWKKIERYAPKLGE